MVTTNILRDLINTHSLGKINYHSHTQITTTLSTKQRLFVKLWNANGDTHLDSFNENVIHCMMLYFDYRLSNCWDRKERTDPLLCHMCYKIMCGCVHLCFHSYRWKSLHKRVSTPYKNIPINLRAQLSTPHMASFLVRRLGVADI